MATTTNNKDESIKLKFEKNVYRLLFVPLVLGMSDEGVVVDKNAPYSHSKLIK